MIDQRSGLDSRTSDPTYAALIGALPDLMFRFSRDGRYLEYVGGDDTALALPPESFVGKFVRDTLPDIGDNFDRAIVETLETDSTVYFEYEIAIPIGSTNIREFEARMVKSGDDEVLAIVRDVTERNQTAEALREHEADDTRQEMLNQISLALTHHLRNAVSPILIYAEQLNPSDPASGERLKNAALEQGQRIAAIASAIDQMARTGELPTTDAWGDESPEMLDLEPLIQRYLASL